MNTGDFVIAIAIREQWHHRLSRGLLEMSVSQRAKNTLFIWAMVIGTKHAPVISWRECYERFHVIYNFVITF